MGTSFCSSLIAATRPRIQSTKIKIEISIFNENSANKFYKYPLIILQAEEKGSRQPYR